MMSEPTRKPSVLGDGYEEEHESFGTISIHHVHASPGVRLFQSHVRSPTFIKLEIHEGRRRHSYHEDKVFEGKLLTEVWLTHNQFAEFITTPNMGSGTPCTLRFVAGDGKWRDDLPNDPSESERSRDSFKDHILKLQGQLLELLKEAEGVLSSPMKVVDRKRLSNLLRQISMNATVNIPFIAEQFQEVTDRVVTNAKGEIEGFLTAVVKNAGLQALQNDPGQVLAGFLEDSTHEDKN